MWKVNPVRGWFAVGARASVVPARVVALDWLLFVASVGILLATIWGKFRSTGPVILVGFTVFGWVAGAIDRRAASRRLAVLLVAFAAAYAIRHYSQFSPFAHRVGRLVLVSGLGLTAILSTPLSLVSRLAVLSARLTHSPRGYAAVIVALLGVALPVTVCQWNTSIHVWTGDTLPLVPTVVQMAKSGSRELSSYVSPSGLARWDICGPGRPYFVREVPTGPGVYSTYPAGMEIFAWPGVLIAMATGQNLRDDHTLFLIEKLTASILCGLSLSLFFLIGLRIGSPEAAYATTWLLALGSVFTTTLGMLLWQQGGIVFWLLVVLLVEFSAQGKVGWKGILLQGLACGCMLACRPSAVTFLVPFGLWVLARDWRRGLLVPLCAIVCYLPWAALYYAIYRNPFGPSMGFLSEQWFPGEHILGVLFSPARGLFVYQPWMLFLGLLAFRKVRANPTNAPAGWATFAIATAACQLVLIGSWPIWWGGYCYGSRLVAEIVPIAGLFAIRPVGYLLSARWGWAAVTAIGLLGFAIHAPCAYYDAWLWNPLPISIDANPWRLYDWSRPPFLYNLMP